MCKTFNAIALTNSHPAQDRPSAGAEDMSPRSHTERGGEKTEFAFSEHWLIRYYQQTLWQQHPLLLLLLMHYARQQHWSEQQWLQCRRQSLQDLLSAIELPATEANCRALMHSSEEDEVDELLDHDLSALAALYQFFKSGSASLLSAAALPQAIMRLLQRAFMTEASGAYPRLAAAS
ncbi:hypothetical protein [Methylobacter sp. BBA5.1]|uniref:hypothetical protein n=1 Tax=Methylobacter sp. BBA5.1 TaxID=1495064 RepID=UPI000561E340|nr:hypothetical protein [Methylobacter sp. BBA5.1]